jgi:hypothetical protein
MIRSINTRWWARANVRGQIEAIAERATSPVRGDLPEDRTKDGQIGRGERAG